MKNANMPAMPVRESDEHTGTLDGLTKREHIAGLAMQATRTAYPDIYPRECAARSVDDTDALLSALEGTTE